MAKAFRRKGSRVVGRLDEIEREVVSGLMSQTRELLAPSEPAPTAGPSGGDAFDDLMASMDLPQGTFEASGDSGGGSAAGPVGEWRAEDAERDPALERLLPSANREDPDAAAEFRALTEHGLRQRKTANLTAAIDALAAVTTKDKDKVDLDRDQAQAFMIALVDVRLLLGERLGLHTDEDADALAGYLAHARPGDPRAALAAYYDFLTWLQESLTQALMR